MNKTKPELRTYRRHIDQSHQEATHRGGQRHLPVLPALELVADDRDNCALQGHNGPDAQDEEHEEEQDGEELRHRLELGDGVRVRDEGQPGATAHHIPDILDLQVVRQVAQNGEYRDPAQQAGQRVQRGHDHGIAVDAMVEAIVRGEHDDRPGADGQREEALHHRLLPDRGVQQLAPLRLQEEDDAVLGALQRHGSDEQHEEHHVGEQGQEVGRLAGALHAAHDHQEDDHPGDEQRQRQLPVRTTNAVRDVQLLLDHYVAAGSQI